MLIILHRRRCADEKMLGDLGIIHAGNGITIPLPKSTIVYFLFMLPLDPISFRVSPDRVGGFGSEEVVEAGQKIFISIVIAQAFAAHPNIHLKVLEGFG